MPINLFVYGTLMFPEVARSLAGDVGTGQRAIFDGFARWEATLRAAANYPYVVASPGDSVEGLLFRDISPRQLEIFDWFEGEGTWYHRIQLNRLKVAAIDDPNSTDRIEFNEVELNVGVYVIGSQLEKAISDFAQSAALPLQKRSWDPDCFYRNYIATYFRNTVIPTVNDPEFKRRFGGPGDPGYVQQLMHRLG